jgi:hypothetical protein
MGDITNTTPDRQGTVVRTICEVHREVYRELYNVFHNNGGTISQESFDYLTTHMEEAFEYAKKMNNKLRQYKHNYDDGWWQRHRLDGGEINELVKIQEVIKKDKSE